MNEKKMRLEKILPYQNRVLLDVLLIGILNICTLFLPVATYVYQKNLYVIKGIRFLTGASIMKGKVVIEANVIALLIVIVSILIILVAIAFMKLQAKMSGKILLGLTLVQFVLAVVFSKNIMKILETAKGKEVSLSSGSIALVILSLVLLVRVFHILYKNKVMVALDFMALPGVLYFLVNNYFPMFGIFIAFKKINYTLGILESPWVGFNNFKYLFTTQDAWIMTRNTILYNVAFIIIGNVIGVALGLMLYEITKKTWQKFFQTTILLPQLISMIIVAYIVYGFLSNEAGLINVRLLGKENGIDFYMQKSYWPFILILVNTWKTMGYGAIIYLSSIVGIDRSLYEAAKVDGATKLQQIFQVTLPLLKPTIITLVIMQVGRIFYSDFGLFLQVPMNSGTIFNATQTIDTYVYRALMTMNQIGKASAASVYQSVVGFAVVLMVNGLVRKVDKDNAMF